MTSNPAADLTDLAARAVSLAAELVRVADELRQTPRIEAATPEPPRARLHDSVTWFNTTQAGAYVDRAPETVVKACQAKELHGSQRIKNGRWRIHRDCLDAWIAGDLCARHR